MHNAANSQVILTNIKKELYNMEFPFLFSPIKINQMELKHRIVMAAAHMHHNDDGYVNDRMQAVRLLEKLVKDSSNEGISYGSLPWAIETATWRSFPQIASFVYRELQSTGNLALIQAESLRRNLAV